MELPPALSPTPTPCQGALTPWRGGFSHLHSPHSLGHLSPGRGDTSTAVDEGTGLTGLAGRGLQEKRLQQHLQIGVAFWGGSHGKKGAAPCSDIPSAAALKCLQPEQHGGDTALPDPPRRWWRLGKIREPEHIAGT